MKRDGGTIIIRSILVIAVLLSAPDRASGQQQAHREAIDKTYRRWVDATNAKDLDRWVTFLAPDPIFLPPGHPALHGAKAIRDYYELLFTDDRFALDCRQERVKLAEAEDMAWSKGSCEATFTGPDGDAARVSSKWAKVWIRLPNGEWKCTLNSWSLNGPSPLAATVRSLGQTQPAACVGT